MTMNLTRIVLVVAAMAAMLAGIGCGPQKKKMGRYDLVVTPDASLRDSGTGRMPKVEVDLVGVKDDEAGTWMSYSLDKYLSGDDELRRGASGFTKTVLFEGGSETAVTIPASDPIWNAWAARGATKLFILANARTLRAGDLRRKDIPITTEKWEVKKIDIVVKSSGVEVPTPMKVVE